MAYSECAIGQPGVNNECKVMGDIHAGQFIDKPVLGDAVIGLPKVVEKGGPMLMFDFGNGHGMEQAIESMTGIMAWVAAKLDGVEFIESSLAEAHLNEGFDDFGGCVQ